MGTTKAQRKTKGAPGKVRRAASRAWRKDRFARTTANKARRIQREARKSIYYDGKFMCTRYSAKSWRIIVGEDASVLAVRVV